MNYAGKKDLVDFPHGTGRARYQSGKRRRIDDEDEHEKKANQRRAANRLAAAKSRQRCKSTVEELQKQVSLLHEGNNELRDEARVIEAKLAVATMENQFLRREMNLPPITDTSNTSPGLSIDTSVPNSSMIAPAHLQVLPRYTSLDIPGINLTTGSALATTSGQPQERNANGSTFQSFLVQPTEENVAQQTIIQTRPDGGGQVKRWQQSDMLQQYREIFERGIDTSGIASAYNYLNAQPQQILLNVTPAGQAGSNATNELMAQSIASVFEGNAIGPNVPTDQGGKSN